jgi:hypothetical protein
MLLATRYNGNEEAIVMSGRWVEGKRVLEYSSDRRPRPDWREWVGAGLAWAGVLPFVIWGLLSADVIDWRRWSNTFGEATIVIVSMGLAPLLGTGAVLVLWPVKTRGRGIRMMRILGVLPVALSGVGAVVAMVVFHGGGFLCMFMGFDLMLASVCAFALAMPEDGTDLP